MMLFLKRIHSRWSSLHFSRNFLSFCRRIAHRSYISHLHNESETWPGMWLFIIRDIARMKLGSQDSPISFTCTTFPSQLRHFQQQDLHETSFVSHSRCWIVSTTAPTYSTCANSNPSSELEGNGSDKSWSSYLPRASSCCSSSLKSGQLMEQITMIGHLLISG